RIGQGLQNMTNLPGLDCLKFTVLKQKVPQQLLKVKYLVNQSRLPQQFELETQQAGNLRQMHGMNQGDSLLLCLMKKSSRLIEHYLAKREYLLNLAPVLQLQGCFNK